MELAFIPNIIGVTERSHLLFIGLITLANPIMLQNSAPKSHSKVTPHQSRTPLQVLVYASESPLYFKITRVDLSIYKPAQRKGSLSNRQPAECNIPKTLCCLQACSRDLEEAKGKKCMSVVQTEDPQTGKP